MWSSDCEELGASSGSRMYTSQWFLHRPLWQRPGGTTYSPSFAPRRFRHDMHIPSCWKSVGALLWLDDDCNHCGSYWISQVHTLQAAKATARTPSHQKCPMSSQKHVVWHELVLNPTNKKVEVHNHITIWSPSTIVSSGKTFITSLTDVLWYTHVDGHHYKYNSRSKYVPETFEKCPGKPMCIICWNIFRTDVVTLA